MLTTTDEQRVDDFYNHLWKARGCHQKGGQFGKRESLHVFPLGLYYQRPASERGRNFTHASQPYHEMSRIEVSWKPEESP